MGRPAWVLLYEVERSPFSRWLAVDFSAPAVRASRQGAGRGAGSVRGMQASAGWASNERRTSSAARPGPSFTSRGVKGSFCCGGSLSALVGVEQSSLPASYRLAPCLWTRGHGEKEIAPCTPVHTRASISQGASTLKDGKPPRMEHTLACPCHHPAFLAALLAAAISLRLFACAANR